jgi:hypothetical protein
VLLVGDVDATYAGHAVLPLISPPRRENRQL